MKLVTLLTLAFTLIGISWALSPVNILARSLDTEKVLSLGVLVHNETLGKPQVIDIPEDLDLPESSDEPYCIGSEMHGNFICHSFQTLSKPLNLELILTTKPENGELVSMSFKNSLKKSNYGINVFVRPITIGAKPVLKDAKPIKVTATGEEEKEEEPQSFIQKYWMFIVPVLILFLSSSGGAQ